MQQTGATEIDAIIRDLDDDQATIIMVDSNIQRENILPTERGFAYKMKLDEMKHQGKRVDLTCAQVGHKLNPLALLDVSWHPVSFYRQRPSHLEAGFLVAGCCQP